MGFPLGTPDRADAPPPPTTLPGPARSRPVVHRRPPVRSAIDPSCAAANRPSPRWRDQERRKMRRKRPPRDCCCASMSARMLGPIELTMSSAASSTAAAEPSSSPAGSGGVAGGVRLPWVQATSASRRSNAGHGSGQRHGASGARSRLHFLTVSPFGYERLSKFLHSIRIGTAPMYRGVELPRGRRIRCDT